jgi:hypothetical protein
MLNKIERQMTAEFGYETSLKAVTWKKEDKGR